MVAPARTAAATETGCLVIADISGYTGYVVGGPLEFTEEVVADVIDTIAGRLGQVLRVNKREGDAVFAYAAEGEADASLILDAVEECYFAFRSRLEGISHSTTCSCTACRKAAQLDLKFILHAGEWVRRGEELTGADVIVAHRLLKNGVGLSAYALVTEAFAAANGLDPELLGLEPHAERCDDVGEVRGFVSDLEERYRAERDRRRIEVGAEEAAFAVERVLPLPAAAAWELLTAPGKRLLWQVDDVEEAQAGGRRETGTASICVDGRTKIYEEILDWRPFEYFTESRTPEGRARFLLTTSLTPTSGGTTVVVRGRPVEGRAGRREARRLARRFRADYARLAELAGKGRE
ncbi:MAG: DUF2652 domain-containing protein [Gaiellaceae bacterium]